MHTANEGLSRPLIGGKRLDYTYTVHTYMYVSVFAYAHYTTTERGRGGSSGDAALCCVFWAAVRPNIDIITAGLHIKKQRGRGHTNKCVARAAATLE